MPVAEVDSVDVPSQLLTTNTDGASGNESTFMVPTALTLPQLPVKGIE